MRFDEFSEACKRLDSEMEFSYKSISPSIEFSNTGRRGIKHFSISMLSLITTLKDMRNNIQDFIPHVRYVEGKWRDLFHRHLTDPSVNAMSTVQTLPLFTVINKVLHVVNDPDGEYIEKTMKLTEDNISSSIQYLESQVPDDKVHYDNLSQAITASTGENVIYYGAPGTGKSHAVDNQIVEEQTVRTVFHADTQNSDFVGCLKPRMQGNEIRYEFRPGPFTNAVINASNSPDKHHWLVIEEINRASAAAVFGEIFQLLDRSPESGSSVYSVSLADGDMYEYIHTKAPSALVGGKLKIPSNLSLLATMNSSDQAVMPLDTAFKRRWKFHYTPLKFDVCAQGCLPIFCEDEDKGTISWKDFALSVNAVLSNNGIPEDRHLGPFFLTESELKCGVSALTGKLFMYLWDDVLRHGQASLLFLAEIKTYGQLVKLVQTGKPVFNQAFYSQLPENSVSRKADSVKLIYEPETAERLAEVAENRSQYDASNNDG